MYSYDELKVMLNESKENAKKAIAALLIQSDKKFTAAEISAMVGVSTAAVSNWLSQRDGYEIEKFVRSINHYYRLRCDEETTTTIYINPENPSDTISVKKTRLIYWVQ